MWHATTHVCSTVDDRGTPTAGSRAALRRGVDPAALPNLAGQCTRGTPRPDGPAPGLCHAKRTPCHHGLPHVGAGLVACPLPSPQAPPPGARRRTVTGAAARAAPRLWETSPPLDPMLGRGGLLGARPAPLPGAPRDDSPGTQTCGRALAAGQALAHQPRSAVGVQQTPRDRLLRLAAQPPEWVLGCADEPWWSRLALPARHSWTAGEPRRLLAQVRHKGARAPQALCCDGLLRTDCDAVLRRVVDGRPVSHVTTAWRAWLAQRLAAEGQKV